MVFCQKSPIILHVLLVITRCFTVSGKHFTGSWQKALEASAVTVLSGLSWDILVMSFVGCTILQCFKVYIMGEM